MKNPRNETHETHEEPEEMKVTANTAISGQVGNANFYFSHKAPNFLKEIVIEALTKAADGSELAQPDQEDDSDENIPF